MKSIAAIFCLLTISFTAQAAEGPMSIEQFNLLMQSRIGTEISLCAVTTSSEGKTGIPGSTIIGKTRHLYVNTEVTCDGEATFDGKILIPNLDSVWSIGRATIVAPAMTRVGLKAIGFENTMNGTQVLYSRQ